MNFRQIITKENNKSHERFELIIQGETIILGNIESVKELIDFLTKQIKLYETTPNRV